jgi:hypothetical protein
VITLGVDAVKVPEETAKAAAILKLEDVETVPVVVKPWKTRFVVAPPLFTIVPPVIYIVPAVGEKVAPEFTVKLLLIVKFVLGCIVPVAIVSW